MEKQVARGLAVVAVIALIGGVTTLALGWELVAPIGFFVFVIAVILAVVFGSTPNLPRTAIANGSLRQTSAGTAPSGVDVNEPSQNDVTEKEHDRE